MVNDLLELSKIHAGTMRLKAEPLDLYDLASDAIADLAALAQQHGIALDGGGRRECLALADGPSMGRAIRNVLLNAIVHSAPGSRVIVEVGREGDRAVVAVTDGCGGIPEADLPHVFETGWQKDPARRQPGRWAAGDDSAGMGGDLDAGVPNDGAGLDGNLVPGPAEPAGAMRYSGAGLGLSIVAGIVSAHQGTVTVENVDGGCKFSLLLPGQGPAGEASPAEAPHAAAAAEVAAAGGATAERAQDRIASDAADEQLRAGRAQ
jgi:signal transduction histidine kinase